jgi:hypothetical protein
MTVFLFTYLASLPAHDSAAAIGWLVLSSAALCVALLAILKVIEQLRGRSPNADNLQSFATKSEHQSLVKRVDKFESDTTFQTYAIQRALGRIEGELKSLNKSDKSE